MPILINEVVAEVEPSVTPRHESRPAQAQLPVTDAEYELFKTLSLIEERKARLMID